MKIILRGSCFFNKPFAVGYAIVKNSKNDNPILENDGFNRYFGEFPVEWFLNEMLEADAYMKKCFNNDMEKNFDTVIARVAKICWLSEKEFKIQDEKEKPVVKGHCQLTSKFRGLIHITCNLKTRKTQRSLVPYSHIFSRYNGHIVFGSLVIMAIETDMEIKEADLIAKSSEI